VTTPDPAAVRSVLERVVASPAFAGSDRMSRLLRYVVERTLAGEGDQLKEYVLGVEVFDRDHRYDPRVDSIVRVEARRLRSKLDEYFAGAGAADPVIIDIPKGSYVPVFRLRTPASDAPAALAAIRSEPAAAPGRPSALSRSTMKGKVAAAMLAAAVMALVAGAAWHRPPAPMAVQAQGSRLSIVVLPFATFSGRAEDQRMAARLTDGVTTEFARVGTLSVVSHASARQFAGAGQTTREFARAIGADVVLEASVAVEGERIVVESRLVNAWTDRKVWVQTFETEARGIRALQRQIAESASPVAARITPQVQ
jgi:adenylate cyclase